MARSLIIPNPGNATIEELKLVSRVGSSETATRCTAIQMLLAGATRELVCQALLVTNRALKTPQPWPDKQDEQLREVFFKEQQLIERLDQAILDVINNPKMTQRTTDFGTLF
jgi:hypothetical protein